MTYMAWHLGELWDMITGSPWPARVFLLILAVFLIFVFFSWLAEKRRKKPKSN